MSPKTRHWMWAVAGVLAVLAIAAAGAMHYATRAVKDAVEQTLGPDGDAAAINIRLSSIELLDVRVKAPGGWPTDTALRAKRVVIVPDLREIFSERVRIDKVTIEAGYLPAVRPPQGGGLRVLPNLTHKARKDSAKGRDQRGATIGTVELDGCVLEVFDRSIVGTTQKVRFDNVKGTVKDISVPDLTTHTRIDLHGAIKGRSQQGTIAVRGWVEVKNKDAELEMHVRGVDLALFEPYLVTKTKSGIESGTFNLDIKSNVRKNVLRADGTLTVAKLKLQSSDNPLGAVASLPRRAALGALADEQDRISVPFRLEGSLDDPTFSLTGNTALKTGLAVAKAFGMSFGGIARAFLIIIHGVAGAFTPLV